MKKCMRCALPEPATQSRQGERGSVLIAAILVLIVLAVIAVSATSSSVLESHMSVNSIDQDAAFQAAESALRAGEASILALPARTIGTPACAAPCVATLNSVNGGVFANAPVLPWGTAQTAQVTTGAGVYAGVATPPEMVVEYIGFVPDQGSTLGIGGGQSVPGSDFFRVTSRGTGRTNTAQAIVQSTFARRF